MVHQSQNTGKDTHRWGIRELLTHSRSANVHRRKGGCTRLKKRRREEPEVPFRYSDINQIETVPSKLKAHLNQTRLGKSVV